ncbi:hypothetical protein [Magnetospirillum sp. 15-1]|uniref:hypothetical protein n=1 Tax=Magnetospirillum sp. 15-1 TaxID=1979370 RepID=UPI0011424011|nr:hypothetical protein [Magnetospirillum sp. 15-1]
MGKFGKITLLTAMIAASGGSVAAAASPQTRVYSSLCRDSASGDASGYRIRLPPTAKGQDLSIEWSEGPLMGPAQASRVIADDVSSALEFTLVSDGRPPYTVRGRISAKAIVLESWNWGDGQGPMPLGAVIPRRTADDDSIGDCPRRP